MNKELGVKITRWDMAASILWPLLALGCLAKPLLTPEDSRDCTSPLRFSHTLPTIAGGFLVVVVSVLLGGFGSSLWYVFGCAVGLYLLGVVADLGTQRDEIPLYSSWVGRGFFILLFLFGMEVGLSFLLVRFLF